MENQAKQGSGVPLALTRPETKPRAAGQSSLKVSSTSISGAIPRQHSEYADGISPQIAWSAVPGAKSYALILEDPDAKAVVPFVHWVAWNIPGDLTSLPEGLQEHARLAEPEGVLQGKTSRGSVGYFGPRPPVGHGVHHYHFQIFALAERLPFGPETLLSDLVNALKGDALASADLIVTYEAAGA